MCGRFALTLPPELLMELFGLASLPSVAPRYNIAPTQAVAIIRKIDGGRKLELVRWGLVPHWAKDLSIGAKLINARSETLATKASFREAFRSRRCVIPADGFYEWMTEGKKKVPWFICRKDRQPVLFAGLWDRWVGPEQMVVESCTIVTTEANQTVRPLHDRMPVILGPEQAELWLSPDPASMESLSQLLVPAPEELLTSYQVNPLVNSAGHDDPACLEPATPGAYSQSEQPSLF
ncbi:SOS response-associated peptidase [Geomesophilobacter sediminis]|uniref:Abasic site processing protein n=1 Tax=Geomesophilobacter sediminis TaxID=2798584 RepID=A0A8J7IWP2_9BACT|nr:SOS response-associated peptidase [Geomesophilobacter sediminis]MBJ6723992.1 SOS response-associated peptidase [Geomesophilobacter sediminis]